MTTYLRGLNIDTLLEQFPVRYPVLRLLQLLLIGLQQRDSLGGHLGPDGL